MAIESIDETINEQELVVMELDALQGEQGPKRRKRR